MNEATIERKKATKIFTCAKIIYNLGHKGSCKSLNSKELCSLQTERLISTTVFISLFLVFVLATYYMRNPGCSEIFWVDDSTQRLVQAKYILQVRKSRQQFAKRQYRMRWHQMLEGPQGGIGFMSAIWCLEV